MYEHYSDEWLTVYGGDCRTVLTSLPADSVDCVVTSPPYWGLRDYGTAAWEGGDAECDHKQERPVLEDNTSTLGIPAGGGQRRIGANNATVVGKGVYRDVCGKCGATRQDSQLGLERTPEEYVANMVAVFREVRRVLKPSGTCWLNLGDSYAGGGGFAPNAPSNLAGAKQTTQRGSLAGGGIKPQGIIKSKDLVGIPWRVAFALQADGWYLRSDIIWAKPNPMPESVTDRPTKSHEYLFLLTKSARYYFDADAVRESAVSAGEVRGGGQKASTNGIHANRSDGQNLDRLGQLPTASGRNLRSVWTIATRPYPGAHFAVFPPELPERCIKAGSPEGGVVLDPFAGSGTTGMVANRLSRRAILIDLNPDYLKQQMKRNAQTPLGLDAA